MYHSFKALFTTAAAILTCIEPYLGATLDVEGLETPMGKYYTSKNYITYYEHHWMWNNYPCPEFFITSS